MRMPRPRLNTLAAMNHDRVRTKVRPTAPPEPMWAMPTVSVASTSGAMIILINRRNTSVMIDR